MLHWTKPRDDQYNNLFSFVSHLENNDERINHFKPTFELFLNELTMHIDGNHSKSRMRERPRAEYEL